MMLSVWFDGINLLHAYLLSLKKMSVYLLIFDICYTYIK